MNIAEFTNSGTQVCVMVTPADLKEFALFVMAQAKEDEKEMARKNDKQLTAQETAEQLGISVNCLWRWEKVGVLEPAYRLGRRPYYLQSQIEDLKKQKGGLS